MGSSVPPEDGLPAPPPTAPPDAVRAAIKARVLAASLGQEAEPATLGGRYRLIREIGRGGIGTVWEAELEPLGRKFAIKLLRARRGQDADAAKRLVREAVNVSQIGHPHIVAVHDVGTDDAGAPYLVMDVLQGESLASLLARDGALPWADVRIVAEQICDALGAAHRLGVVHRDVKPANVFVRRSEVGRWHCTLLDFGLCKASDAVTVLTAQGMLLGTPGYMAPEQIRGEAVDPRADIYAVACIVVEALSGRPAFGGSRREEILAAQLAGTHSPLPDALPPTARDAVRRALSVDPRARPGSADELRRALSATSLPRTHPASGSDLRPRSSRARFHLLGIVTAVAFAAGVAVVLGSRPDATEPDVRVDEDESFGAVEPPLLDMGENPEPRAVASPSTPDVPTVAVEPAAEPPVADVREIPRRIRRRTARDAARREPSAPPEAPRSAPRVERELVDGIRDPFAAE